MSIMYIFFGFMAKIITGLDDVITHIPILSSVTKRKLGRFAFSLGTLFAIFIAIIASIFFASFLKDFLYYNYITSALLIILAAGIYFDVFIRSPEKKVEKKLEKIRSERLIKLFGIGIISSLATILDDVVVFIPFFINGLEQSAYSSLGIILATILEIFVVIFFAKKLVNIKHKEKITSAGLIILSILILFRVI